jgi:choline-sulfatase
VPTVRLLLLSVLLIGCSRVEPAPDVVIVTWDTTRADHVGPDAAVLDLTPGFDALAATGTRFSNVRSPAPVTLPAHATVMTGLLPHEHGVRTNGLFALGDGPATLAERMTEGGYSTAAFVSATVLDDVYGLARGFSTYDDRVENEPGHAHFARRGGSDTVDAALAWLKTQRQPVLLWVHLFDAHLPLDPPADLLARHGDPYAAAIASLDAETRRLLDGVRAHRGSEPIAVITADHGEGRGDHGERTHAYFAYDSTLAVPLLIAGPGFAPGIDDRLAHLGDIAPTLAARLGLAPLGTGTDLRGPPSPRSLPVESIEPVYAYGTAPIFGVITEDAAWFDLPTPERYDLKEDPGQLTNLWEPADAERAPFAAFDRRWPPEGQRGLDPEEAAQLVALGYLSAESAGPVEGGRDPKDLLPVAALCMDVEADALPEDVVAQADELLEAFGPVPMLSVVAADALTTLGRPADARARLQAAARAHPKEERVVNRLALSEREAAADRSLEAAIRAALATDPEHATAHFDLAVVVHRLGRLDEAVGLYRAVLVRGEDLEARLGLARALGGGGRLADALAALSGDAPEVRCARGTLLKARLDRADDAAADLAFCP